MPTIEPSVEVEIEGIVVLSFETDDTGQVVACMAGAVSDVPDHELEIVARKIANNTVEDFTFASSTPELLLEAEGTTHQGISFAASDAVIDRIAGTGAPESFRWVLNFSGQELHNHDIPLVPAGFRSMLRITNGVLFTKVISRNHLLTRDADNPNEPLTLVGKVATEVGVRIQLEAPGSIARLSSPNQTITVQPGERLFVRFRQICTTDDPNNVGLQAAHANHYYNALAVADTEKKAFSSTRVVTTSVIPPVSPEASCLVGRVGP